MSMMKKKKEIRLHEILSKKTLVFISGLMMGGIMNTYLKLFQDRKVEYGLSMTSDLYEQMDV